MIIVDGIYSMEGDIADVPSLLKIAPALRRRSLAIDDANSVACSSQGRRTAAALRPRRRRGHHRGHVSKSLASIGGFAAGTGERDHFLKHHSRPLIFTAALPPANTAGVLAALHVMQREPERRERLWENAAASRTASAPGLRHRPDRDPIVPVLIGRSTKTSCSGASCSTPACSRIRSCRPRCRRRNAGCAPA